MHRVEGNPNPPTERELRLAAEWSRVARLMNASLQARIDFDPTKIEDPFARFAPLKTLLNDVFVRQLYACGDRQAARELRRIQRQKFSQLLTMLATESRLSQEARVKHMDDTGSWGTYTDTFQQAWLIRYVLGRLRLALWMHALQVPGALWMAQDTCKHLRRLLPPAEVIPIRA